MPDGAIVHDLLYRLLIPASPTPIGAGIAIDCGEDGVDGLVVQLRLAKHLGIHRPLALVFAVALALHTF